VCKSKKQGDLGLLDLEMMNTALLAKWQIRFQDLKVTDKWKDIILAKYSSNSAKYSSFWKVILKDKDLIELDFNKLVG
jgi:hypothetical protein